MTQAQGKIKVYVYSSLILSLLCALCFTTAYLFYFEPYIGYFKSASLMPSWAVSTTLLALFWIISSLITIPKGSVKAEAIPYGKGSAVMSGITSAGFAAYTLYRLFVSRTVETVPATLTLACILFGALCALYFLLAARNKNNGSSGLVFAGFAPIFWAALSMTEVYVNKNIAMNNPLKVSYMMAMMAFMLFMVYDLRYRLGRGMPRLFLVFSLTGVLVSSIFAIPFLVVTISGRYTLDALLASSCVILLLDGYIFCRIVDFVFSHSSAAPDGNPS